MLEIQTFRFKSDCMKMIQRWMANRNDSTNHGPVMWKNGNSSAARPLPKLRLSLMCGLALVIAGCTSKAPDSESPVENTTQKPVSVEVAHVESITLQPTLELVGQIIAIPENTAVISAQNGGWVSKLEVVEGQSVKAGAQLIQLDPRSAEIAVQRANAAVAEKTAAVIRLKSGYLPEEIAGAKQDAGNAAATVDGLKNELVALNELLSRQEISSVVYETKSKTLASAQAVLASAQERVKLLESGTRPELIVEANSLLDAAKADAKQAELLLDWCTVTCPIDGVVVQLQARHGQFFDRAVPLVTVLDLSQVFAQIRVPIDQFGNVKIGTGVTLNLSSLPGEVFSGKVTRVSGTADAATGNVLMFALVDNPNLQLRPGFNCQVELALPGVANALVIPVAAIADNSGTPVVTIIRDGKAYETEVKLGIETADQVQVLQGLKSGDMIAVAGGYGLPEGCSVEVVSELKSR